MQHIQQIYKYVLHSWDAWNTYIHIHIVTAVMRQERPQTAFDMRQVQRELDEHADQLEMQVRINTAENLPLGPHEWQHDHAGKDLLHTRLRVIMQ